MSMIQDYFDAVDRDLKANPIKKPLRIDSSNPSFHNGGSQYKELMDTQPNITIEDVQQHILVKSIYTITQVFNFISF